MLKRIEPERIICYNTPFPEMQGNIVFVDYELSSWKYQDKNYKSENYKKYMCGELILPKPNDIIVKIGHIISDFYSKGMGSANGGKWRPSPNKPQDQRFLGKPGEIKTYTKENGEVFLPKIGEDGRGTIERHCTDHNQPWAHTNPHDHIIHWSKGFPNLIKQAINYPDGAPEFKSYKEIKNMGTVIHQKGFDVFESISDFKWCIKCGGEVDFEWKGKRYSITQPGKISISEAFKQETELLADTADEIL